MKKIVILFFVLLMLFGSCAIHKEFPFICINPKCVANQFKYNFNKIKVSLKASSSKMNLKASMRKKKRYADNRKKKSIENNAENSDELVNSGSGIRTFEVLKPDSVLSNSISDSATTFDFNVGIGNLDTVIILKYKVSIDSISQEDSLILRNFFYNRKDQKMRVYDKTNKH